MKSTTTIDRTALSNAYLAALLAAEKARDAQALTHHKWVELNKATLAAKVAAQAATSDLLAAEKAVKAALADLT